MKRSTYISLTIGVTAFISLLVWQGIGTITDTLIDAGWGLLLVTAFHLIPMVSSSMCWQVLLPSQQRVTLPRLLTARWIGESINSLLPVAQIGGEFAKARWVMRHGITGETAGSTVVVEVTISLLTQLIFTLVGLTTLLWHLALNQSLIVEIVLGMAVMIGALFAFYSSQQHHLFETIAHLLQQLSGGNAWLEFSGGACRLDRAIVAIYRQKKVVFIASAWRLFSWFLGVGEVWLLMTFLGHPVTLVEALLLESLGQAIRASGFLIPGSLGIQEGGFLLLGSILGIPPHTALALSLGKRIREGLLGIPGLITWHIVTSQRLWKQYQSTSKQVEP